MGYDSKQMQINKFLLSYRTFLCVFLDIIFVFLFTLFILFYANGGNSNILYFLLYTTFFDMFFYLVLKGAKENIAFLLFVVSFYTFLMGSKLIPFIDISEKNIFTLFRTVQLNSEEYMLFLNLLFLSLTSAYIAYRLTKSLNLQSKQKFITSHVNLPKYYNLKLAIKILLPIFLIASIVEAFISWNYISSVGYVESYVTTIQVPTIISKPAALFPALVVIIFALEPTREEVKLTTKYYIISLLCTVFSGRRTDLVIGLLFIIWYLCVIDNKNTFSKKFLTKQRIILVGIFSFLLIAFLGAYSFIRANLQTKSMNLLDYISYFFKSLGRSDTVIADTIINIDNFPKSGFNYFIYPIKDFVSSNILTRDVYEVVTGLKSYTSVGQGISKLDYTDSFSHWLTYIVAPDLYINGHGLGSSYIAETFIAFGVIGVVVYSILLGCLLNTLSNLNLKKVWSRILLMIVLKSILFAPRGPAIGFIDGLYEVILTFIIVYVVSLILRGRKGLYRSE
ncbi:O-antigen polysaccharide polymerase Wzy family protein [Peribacillus frigoritolerans]|uniref:O-antigen polysaccharide polymerase Wzy family protein n=1 Tax=Peribacillus frigoritolerans TaxID=450367 RepID=UPI0039A0987C